MDAQCTQASLILTLFVPAMDFFSSSKLDTLRTLLLSSIQVNIEGLAKTKSRHPRSTAAYKLSKDIATTWKLIPPILGPTTLGKVTFIGVTMQKRSASNY